MTVTTTVIDLGVLDWSLADCARLRSIRQILRVASSSRPARWAVDAEFLDEMRADADTDGLLSSIVEERNGSFFFEPNFQLYYRRGLGFVHIIDHRSDGSYRLVLDGDEAAFVERLAAGVDVDSLDDPELRLLNELDAEQLVYSANRWAVLVAPRLRRWPVPDQSI